MRAVTLSAQISIVYIEKVSTGTLDMIDLCERAGLPSPTFRQDGGQFVQVLWRPAQEGTKSGPSRDQVGTKIDLDQESIEILRACMTGRSMVELLAVAGRTNRTKFREQVIRPLLDAGFIEMTVPEKPKSSKQRYRLTVRGRARLNELEE